MHRPVNGAIFQRWKWCHVIEMRCLKHRVGLTTVMEDTTDHLPDIGIFKIPEFIDGPHELLPLRGKIDTHLTRYVLLKISEKHQVLMEKHWRTCNSANKYYKTNFTELMSDVSFCFVIHYNNIMLFQTIFMTYTFKLLCKQFCLQPFSQKDSVSYSLLSSLPL